ncbi:YaiI/YqxD family protein [Herbaspirillum sp. alder98]|uniref:YaiI/YqxD family protein n=1 Tax=Herbaspirillum sp. alder98 TaxID=2913096 RepID=UPI001CD8547C|nr:YaiI/YqxD family protein [Herbaspirillum sp. alder98]MCA1324378.1 YaiI/YqxD family protein [Herbaspirillum sp. alder98]
MNIWVDADACPGVIKDMLFRVADRTGIVVTLVANRSLRTPPSRYIKSIVVPAGFDVADNEIVRLTDAGDLVITADIPLAAAVVEKGGSALNPRGEMYTRENIGQHLGMRNFMEELRSSGVETGGPAAFSAADGRAFARVLDRLVAQRKPPAATAQ